jgi:tetratricopeptide (TPR) repeat protein
MLRCSRLLLAVTSRRRRVAVLPVGGVVPASASVDEAPGPLNWKTLSADKGLYYALIAESQQASTSQLREWVPTLSAEERATVTRVVCADMSVRGTRAHLHCLRSMVSLGSSLSAEELDWHSESVVRRWLALGMATRAHVEFLVLLLLQSQNRVQRARALVWLGDALRYQLSSGLTFVAVVQHLLSAGDVDTPQRNALDALLATLPANHLTFWPDLNWKDILQALIVHGQMDAFVTTVESWFALVPSPTLLKEGFFSTALAALARAQRRDLAEMLVNDYMMKRAGLKLTNLTYGVMIQLYGRCGDIASARKWYEEGLKVLPQRNSVFYIQMLDAEAFLGRWSDVKRVAEKMIEEIGDDRDPNPNMYSTVLEAMVRTSNFDELDLWFNMAKERGQVDDKLLERYQFCLTSREKRRQAKR